MGAFSIWHWLIVLAVVLILFGGGGKLSRLMGDLGKGLNAFRKNVSDEKTTTAKQDEAEEPAEISGDKADKSTPTS